MFVQIFYNFIQLTNFYELAFMMVYIPFSYSLIIIANSQKKNHHHFEIIQKGLF